MAQAQKLRDKVARDVEQTTVWKGWLWKLRFSQAEAELALASDDAGRALELP